MVSKATPTGGEFTDEQKAEAEAMLREMNKSSTELLASFNKVSGKRGGKRKAQ